MGSANATSVLCRPPEAENVLPDLLTLPEFVGQRRLVGVEVCVVLFRRIRFFGRTPGEAVGHLIGRRHVEVLVGLADDVEGVVGAVSVPLVHGEKLEKKLAGLKKLQKILT